MLTYGPAILIIFSVFFGILMGRRDVNSLKEDMNRRFTEMNVDMNRRFAEMSTDISRQFGEVNRRLTKLEDDYLEFYGMEKKLEGRVDELSRH